jgi:hypothetical protein
MAQHDYVISNASGATVRADINSALSAIQTLNSGTSAPSSTAAGMLWLDTTGGAPYALKIRDAGNNHWLTLASVTDPGSDGNIETSATIKGTIDSSATFPTGSIIQVVSENFEGTTTASTTAEVTSFITKDISSIKASSKFLVMVNSMTGGDDSTPIVILRRTISGTAHDIVNDDSQGGVTMRSDARLGSVRHGTNFHLSYVDAPAQSASTTINYKIILKSKESKDVFLGRSGFNSGDIKCLSSITIMELAP